jgi:hypothetical protein
MKIKVWSESDHSAVPQGIMGKLRFCKKKKKKVYMQSNLY